MVRSVSGQFSLLDSIVFIASPWNQVPDQAIRKCFDRCGFFAGDWTSCIDDDDGIVFSTSVPTLANMSHDKFDKLSVLMHNRPRLNPSASTKFC